MKGKVDLAQPVNTTSDLWFNGPYGRQGCVLARTVESNQGGRFDVPFYQWSAKRYSRDPNNLEESINAALIEEQNVKLNKIANDERTGLSPLQTETSVISALTNKLEEINLRVKRLQEASSVTARKTGGGLFRRRETVFKCFYSGLEGHKQAECRKRRAEERKSNDQPPWGNAAGEFSVFRQPNTHSFDQRHVHFHDSTFRDNYTAPRHSINVSQRTSRDKGDVTRFRRNTRNDNLNFRGESLF
ncbi:hypothetical protein TNCV_39421 [Trichonephila clavipes]|nr:hypothetical protein TNCV_39421 [Trichonephila clavipes]